MAQTHRTYKREMHPDFPLEPVFGSVAGVQPKLLLTKSEDGSYRSPQRSIAELMDRFEVADDIAEQLGLYFLRKKSQNPGWTTEQNLERIRLALVEKCASGKWPFTPAEQRWIIDRVREDT